MIDAPSKKQNKKTRLSGRAGLFFRLKHTTHYTVRANLGRTQLLRCTVRYKSDEYLNLDK